MRHVRAHEVARRQRGDERQLARHDRRRDYARQLLCVLAGVRRVRAADAEQVEHSALRLEDCPAADRPDLNAGHRDRHQQVLAVVRSTHHS